MSPANPERGEVALALGEMACIVRPSFSALVAAEGEVGSLLRLLERAGEGDVRLADMGALFWHGLADKDGWSDRSRFEAALVEAGVAMLLPTYRRLLASIFGSR